MKYHIDTIPVWDSMKLNGECFLCALARKTELGEAERYLGASVMEPDTRIQVNELGFCRKHHAMLYGMSNRLGHALMLESHTAVTRDKIKKAAESLKHSAAEYAKTPLARLSKNGQRHLESIQKTADELAKLSESCVMCNSISENMSRYLKTFFHLYKNDSEFRDRFASSLGVCLPHMADLIKQAAGELSPKELDTFVQTLTSMEEKNMDRIQEDISWFIKKFDYRFQNEPWKNSRDAVPRTVNKLRGWCVGPEPNPEEN